MKVDCKIFTCLYCIFAFGNSEKSVFYTQYTINILIKYKRKKKNYHNQKI